MKLATAALFLVASTASALAPMRATKSLMAAARRLEDNGDNEQDEEEEYSFLANYKLKLMACMSGETYQNPEDGEYESSSVVFRLCPADAECSNDDAQGCSEGYGDFVVGLNSFVQEYLENKKDEQNGNNNNNGDDNFNMEEFGECREYEVDGDADGDGYNQQYYVGPACSEDGLDVKLDFFTNEGCSVTSDEVTFEDISNGVSLPYSSGGLVSNGCESCAGYNDNGEWELSEMCMKLYENAGKCETNMETYYYTGMQEGSCEYIETMLPKASSSSVGKAIGWTFFVLVVLGAGFAAFTLIKKKKSGDTDKNFGLMNA